MKLEEFKALLLERKLELEEVLRGLRGELEGVDGCEIKDEGDERSFLLESYRGEQLYLQQLRELKEVEEALKRIERGEYGICEMCGEEIGEARLRAKPYARYCITCKSLLEEEARRKN
ncbi:MAG: RNA polymerase-binding protein DksA [Campylobacterales bacterium]